ncbi:c-type cytochrome [Chitinophaga caeni]|nr:c-type cytochrome [Chitinophaga caeni]
MKTQDSSAAIPQQTVKRISKLINLMVVLVILTLAMLANFYWFYQPRQASNPQPSEELKSNAPQLPSVSAFPIMPFPANDEGKLAEYGKKLITETYKFIGPESALKITGNHLACSNCHLDAGTKAFAAPYIGLMGVFPIYIGRENKVESLEERVNGCFERSMNGHALADTSKEMRAIVTYIKHLSYNTGVGKRLEGQGFTKIEVPNRAANLVAGAKIYKAKCVSCHGDHGQGLPGSGGNKEGGYIYPPLWGNDSYNDGAGMARLLTAAAFIKGNMPFGASAATSILSDEEAYDVAAFVNSHDRPVKRNKELDYPDLAKKPKDCPYPPYADNIPREQHRYGPYFTAR